MISLLELETWMTCVWGESGGRAKIVEIYLLMVLMGFSGRSERRREDIKKLSIFLSREEILLHFIAERILSSKTDTYNTKIYQNQLRVCVNFHIARTSQLYDRNKSSNVAEMCRLNIRYNRPAVMVLLCVVGDNWNIKLVSQKCFAEMLSWIGQSWTHPGRRFELILLILSEIWQLTFRFCSIAIFPD